MVIVEVVVVEVCGGEDNSGDRSTRDGGGGSICGGGSRGGGGSGGGDSGDGSGARNGSGGRGRRGGVWWCRGDIEVVVEVVEVEGLTVMGLG